MMTFPGAVWVGDADPGCVVAASGVWLVGALLVYSKSHVLSIYQKPVSRSGTDSFDEHWRGWDAGCLKRTSARSSPFSQDFSSTITRSVSSTLRQPLALESDLSTGRWYHT